MERHDRLHRVHDELAGRYTHEHAERLRSHFERSDAHERVAHHNAQINGIKEKLKGATGSSKDALLDDLKDHETYRDIEAGRAYKAGALGRDVHGQIERLQYAIEAMKQRRSDRSPQATEAHPHMQAMKDRLKQLKNLHADAEAPEGHEDYKHFVHIVHAANGGHEDYGIELKKEKKKGKGKDEAGGEDAEDDEDVAESVSLFDALFEADEAAPAGEEPKKPKRAYTTKAQKVAAGGVHVPAEIGTSPMPAGWKTAVAKHLGVGAHVISRAIGKLFKGPEGEHLTQHVIGVGEKRKTLTRTRREKWFFTQAAREGRLMGTGAQKFARDAYADNVEERARAKLRTGWSADLTPSRGRAPATSTIKPLAPETKQKKDAATQAAAGADFSSFLKLIGRQSPEEKAASKQRGQTLTPAEKAVKAAKQIADAKAQKEQAAADREERNQKARDDALAHIGMKPKKKKGAKPKADQETEAEPEDAAENTSLFGAIFTESRRRSASLFEAVLN
jgi:hypothetical protein